MSLAHALLTSLLEKPSSGYELARRFDKSIGFFWQASHQQIYKELARMEGAGWVHSQGAGDAQRTRKRLYEVLPAGRDELVRWVQEPSQPEPMRDSLMVRLRAEAALGPLDLTRQIAARAELHAQRLSAYLAIEARDFAGSGPWNRERRIQHLILRTGMMLEQSWIDWSRMALEVMAQDGAPLPPFPAPALPAAPPA